MLDGLDKIFEEEKGRRCEVCGSEATHKCNQKIDTLVCETALCDKDACNYVHNLKHHYKNKTLINKYKNNISNIEKLLILEMELIKLKQSKDYYSNMINKFEKYNSVSTMFKNLFKTKEKEISIFESEVVQVKKDLEKKSKYA